MLDINILGGNSYTVADILVERGIPFFFFFCTGYSDWALEERHRNRPRLAKPFSSKVFRTKCFSCGVLDRCRGAV